jgi:ADP-ribose pyrophosphatase YjhB (NUDIX family)
MKDKILECFLYAHRLRFNEIEKQIGERSNKLNYHLKKLVGEGVLFKDGEWYTLALEFEDLIPYVSDKKHVLTVLLVHVGDSEKAFLVRREKRPYKGKLSLPGGRMILGESIEEGAFRILKKFGVKGEEFLGVKSVSLEHLIRDERKVASYLLVYVEVRADARLVSLDKNRADIIESDYLLMKRDFGKSVCLDEINSKI